MDEKGPHTERDTACMIALQTQRCKVTTKEGLTLKLMNEKQVVVGSHYPKLESSMAKSQSLPSLCLSIAFLHL